MLMVTRDLDRETLWLNVSEFVNKHGYATQANLLHIKDDAMTLVNLYRLYALYHCTRQLFQLGQLAKKHKVSGVNTLPRSTLDKEGEESEHSDYCEEDFKDLMSIKQIQQSIKVFYDRLKELINPIDEQRLKLDSVHNVKAAVS